MSVELRPYQWGSVHGIQQFFKKLVRRIVLILPPGAGKTVIAGYMLVTAIARGNRCLFIADREELITQARDKFSSQFGLEAGMIKAKYAPDPSKMLQIASIQTLTRRTRPPAKLVIADECHVTVAPNFLKILQLYYDEGAYIVGLTGTPRLTNKRRGLNEFYDNFVANIPKSQLLAQGDLVPMKCYLSSTIIEKKFSMKDGDFNQAEVMQAFDKADVYKNLLEAYKQFIGKKKCIVFCCGVEHSIKTRDALRSIGVRAEHIDGGTSDEERGRIIEAYRMDLIDCLTNYDILTKGFDVPNTMAVVFNCATASEIRYIQGTGRAERPFPGKTHGIFLDMADNVFRFGHPDEDREPSIEPRINADKEKGIAPMKRCISCGLIIRASATVCPECATEQPVKTKKKTVKEVQFELIEKEDFDVRPYVNLTQRDWHKIPSHLLKAFARHQKPNPYNHGWVTRQLAMRGESRKMIEILDYSGADYHKQKNILEKAYAGGSGTIDAHTWEFVQEKGDKVKREDGTEVMVMHTAVFRYKFNEDVTPDL